ncbi:methyltransferase domain-containing protein [Flavobacterium sp. GSP27]|nr:methyltransferase domain-containing protein [Flavobacterium sp. GSP27]
MYTIIMSKIQTLLKTYVTTGYYGIKCLVKDKFFPYKGRTIKRMDLFLKYFNGKIGIEIGGSSAIFSKEIPIYQVIDSLDGCNFSSQTIWEGTIVEGQNFNYLGSKKGHQYICEASNLKEIPDNKYDFLIASHCLEHCANTLKTVKEWVRVIKKGGAILLILPDKRYTFDHNRPISTFGHFENDLNNGINETDLTHLTEILELHDLNMDLAAGTKEQFKKRSFANHENRCLHHHVFDFKLLQNVYKYFDIKVVNLTFVKPYHQIILGIKR